MRRKLSLMERGFWFGGEYCFNFAMNAQIKGVFSVEELKIALIKVRKKHPLLGVRVELDIAHGAWFNNEDVPEFPIRVVSRTNDDQWIQEVISELKIPFSWVKGPLTRFTLIQSEEISDLISYKTYARKYLIQRSGDFKFYYYRLFEGLIFVRFLINEQIYMLANDVPMNDNKEKENVVGNLVFYDNIQRSRLHDAFHGK